MNNERKYTFIDLFAGCGGLSEGFLSSGRFEGLAHVEWDYPMVNTLRNRLVKKWNHSEEDAKRRVVLFDIQKTDELFNGKWSEESRSQFLSRNSEYIAENGLDGLIDGQKVDVIIGGPPCQAYSIAGRAQDPNGMKNDYRNYLFESYKKVVEHYKPELFVFENVPGMLSACPGGKPVVNRVYEAFESIGYHIRKPVDLPKSVYSAADFECPQERRRIIIIGVRDGSSFTEEDVYSILNEIKSKSPKKTLRDAIGNMPKFQPLEHSIKNGRENVSHTLVGDIKIPLHECRYNNKRDVEIFKEWLEKDMNKLSQEEKLAYYTKKTGKTSNHVKYRSLYWDKPAPTIVAHLYKDGLMFIHPDKDQARSITMREAALLQTFPIDYDFLGSNAYRFKMIGNAVPVMFANKIAQAVIRILDEKVE